MWLSVHFLFYLFFNIMRIPKAFLTNRLSVPFFFSFFFLWRRSERPGFDFIYLFIYFNENEVIITRELIPRFQCDRW